MNKLFFICYDFPPVITPTANRIGKIIKYLQKDWQIQVLTSRENGYLEGITVDSVKPWYPKSLINGLVKLKLEKFLEWFLPFGGEPAFFWIIPAVYQAKKMLDQQNPDAIVVFMMPYATGMIGIILKWLTGIPLVFNYDDSPTCSEMSGNSFPSWIHYQMTVWMENFYASQADAVIYVSKRNLERVRERQPQKYQSKFHLVRYGADVIDFTQAKPSLKDDNCFEITFTGFMGGWFEFYHTPEEQTLLRKLYRAWLNLGRYEVLKLDLRSTSPMFVGKAVQQVLLEHPEWKGKIRINIYGNLYPQYVIERALQNQNLTDIVFVYDALPNEKAIEIVCQSDLLLITLPARPADSPPGGRISAKTYEYLMSDRPILAAVSKGENWDYLAGKPGVWLVEPTDVCAMTKAIKELASAKLSGQQTAFNRTHLYPELSYETRAREFNQVLEKAISNQENCLK